MIDHIGQLKPDPRNARRHNPRNVGMIADALHEVGAARSIVIDEENNILAGNGTIEAAAQAGITKMQVVDADGETIIAVRRSGLSAKAKKRLALYDNRTAELAEWEPSVLAEERDILEGLFTPHELDDILAGLEGESTDDPGAQLDRAAELQEKWGTQRGQLWQVGRHRLLCGDSTSADDVARLMGGEKAAAIITDPPYGIGYHSNQPAFHGGARFVNNEFGADDLDTTWLTVWFAVMAADSTAYVFTRWDVLAIWQAAIQSAGLTIRQRLVWDKSHFTMGNLAYYGSQVEDILFCTKGKPRLHWDGRRGNLVKTPTITYSPDARTPHATQKPLAIIEPWVQDATREGDCLVDPFIGSGTTMVAAEQTGRTCYGCEIEPKYVAVTLERMAGMGLEPRLIDG